MRSEGYGTWSVCVCVCDYNHTSEHRTFPRLPLAGSRSRYPTAKQQDRTGVCVCVCVSVCLCLSSLISDLARIHVQQEIPTASVLHG